MQEQQKQRVTVYIDGFNLYHGLRKMKKTDPDWQRFYWLDFVKLFDHFILPGQTLQKLYYFSAPDHDSVRSERQLALFRANKLMGGERFEVIYGKYYKKKLKCKLCTGRYETHEEKRTDVNICAYMMSDCALNKVDAIMLVTADSDLVTPIELIRRDYPDKKLRLFFPPTTGSRDLVSVMKVIKKEPIYLLSHKQKFINSVLPDIVSIDGVTLTIPQKWKDPYIASVSSDATAATVMDIYAKHFGTAQTIDCNHPNIAAFIRDLNRFSSCPNCPTSP